MAGGRCLLCRSSCAVGKGGNTVISSQAVTSFCQIFGLSSVATNNPFRCLIEKANYCTNCLKEIKEADKLLAQLEIVKQQLLRFQNRVYSKLGDNYFQIEKREEIQVTADDFEEGGRAIKGKRFGYNEVVKVFYESKPIN